MKVLVIVGDRCLPTITATRVRNRFLWPALSKLGVEVKVRGALRERDLGPDPGELGPPGIDCRFFEPPRASLPVRTWMALTHSYHEWPRIPALASEVDRLCEAWKPDVIHAEELRSGYYLPAYRRVECAALQTCTIHNVESDLLRMTGSAPLPFARAAMERQHVRSLEKYERRVARSCGALFAYSEVDQRRYREIIPGAYWLTTRGGTNASSIGPYHQIDRADVLIVGSLSYAPNIRGLFWFLDHVLPLLPRELHVTVAGSRATPIVRERLARAPRVAFVDEPKDLGWLYDQAALCAVPILEGSGTRGRILEALARERMVVTTPIGAEGLAIPQECGVVRSGTPEEFAQAIQRWQGDMNGRAAAARLGVRYVAAHHDWAVVASELKAHWESLADQRFREALSISR